ncbi:MAG TPA: hypothetical protein VGK56_03445, partial [Anaerolineales bacterium]
MSDDVEKTDPLQEPSVLDYVKSLFHFGNGERIQIPVEDHVVEDEKVREMQAFRTETPVLPPVDEHQRETLFVEAPTPAMQPVAQAAQQLPWRSLLAFLLAWIGQRT